jgi:2-(1,2-epoxy-1,2-dihydrophenyl)acetyl-CoA isomerase
MAGFSTILFKAKGSVATLTLNRTEELNALNADMGSAILQALEDIEKNRDIRALIVTGAGSAFCTGEFPEEPLQEALHACRVPIVTAVNGVAADGGCTLALRGDLVLAARSATFVTAKDSVSAEKALARGMINECLEPETLLPRARELATGLAQGPTRALALTRQLVDEGANNSFEAQYRRELEVNRELREAFDGKEGVQAFLEKRPARFRGE